MINANKIYNVFFLGNITNFLMAKSWEKKFLKKLAKSWDKFFKIYYNMLQL
jgi:hypothetical protein